MLPIVRSHEQYQSFVQEQLHIHYANGSLLFVAKDWSLVKKFWITDLSDTFNLLQETFSCRGPRSNDPADLLRSYLLMLHVGEPSITEWVNQLRRCPLYAILSGFEYGKMPSVGTFYDFFQRLWSHNSANLSPKFRLNRKKVKGGKKGEKAPSQKDDITFSPTGIPFCKKGFQVSLVPRGKTSWKRTTCHTYHCTHPATRMQHCCWLYAFIQKLCKND